jgi:hypothetical protein
MLLHAGGQRPDCRRDGVSQSLITYQYMTVHATTKLELRVLVTPKYNIERQGSGGGLPLFPIRDHRSNDGVRAGINGIYLLFSAYRDVCIIVACKRFP